MSDGFSWKSMNFLLHVKIQTRICLDSLLSDSVVHAVTSVFYQLHHSMTGSSVAEFLENLK